MRFDIGTELKIAMFDAKFKMEDFKLRHSRASRVAEGNETETKGSTLRNKKATKTKVDKAEQESPSEKAGAEKTSATVETMNEAAMAGGHIKDKDPNVIDFSMFGVQMNMNEMSGANPVQPDFSGMVNGVQPPFDPSMMHPSYGPAVVPPMQQQFQQQIPSNGFNPMMQPQVPSISQVPPVMQQQIPMQQEPVHPQVAQYMEDIKKYEQQVADAQKVKVGKGNHKIDNPQPPKPPKIKAEEDKVDVDLNAIYVETAPPKPPKEWPTAVNNPLPQAEVEQEVATPVFDNTPLINKFRYLGDIEKIALENGVQVQFMPRVGLDGNPNGLISCISYTEPTKPNPYKGFTIDTGVIIDKRAKVYPAIVQSGYEDMQAYPVLVPKDDKSEGKGKSKNVINEQLFNDIFKGGVNMLGPRGMYSPDYLELNKCVAMITMPTNNMSGDTRKAVRDRLLAAVKAGVFATAFQHEPNSRFMFKNYDKKTGCFTLTNKGVPYRYGGQYLANKEVEIYFGIDEVRVVPVS